MKYYWLTPKDQRANNWIFIDEVDDTTIVLRDEYKRRACEKCGKFDELQALKETPISEEVKIKSRSDFLCTNDEVICVSTKLKESMTDYGITGVEYIPLPGDPRFFVLLPEKEIPTDIKTCGMGFLDECPKCGRFEATCGFPSCNNTKFPSNAKQMICFDVKIEGPRTRKFWYLVSEQVFLFFKSNKTRGIDFHEGVACEIPNK